MKRLRFASSIAQRNSSKILRQKPLHNSPKPFSSMLFPPHLHRPFCISTDMLISLSLSHQEGSLSSASALVPHLQSLSVLSSPEIISFFHSHPRSLFMEESKALSLCAVRMEGLGEEVGVEITNPAMQAVMLEIGGRAIRHIQGSKQLSILDVGCANGFLTFGLASLAQALCPDTPSSVTGIDICPEIIEDALRIKTTLLEKQVIKSESSSKIHFGTSSFNPFLETSRNHDLILFGIGVSRAEIINTLWANQKDDCIIIAPIFESQTQQGLYVVGPTSKIPSLSSLLSLKKKSFQPLNFSAPTLKKCPSTRSTP